MLLQEPLFCYQLHGKIPPQNQKFCNGYVITGKIIKKNIQDVEKPAGGLY